MKLLCQFSTNISNCLLAISVLLSAWAVITSVGHPCPRPPGSRPEAWCPEGPLFSLPTLGVGRPPLGCPVLPAPPSCSPHGPAEVVPTVSPKGQQVCPTADGLYHHPQSVGCRPARGFSPAGPAQGGRSFGSAETRGPVCLRARKPRSAFGVHVLTLMRNMNVMSLSIGQT